MMPTLDDGAVATHEIFASYVRAGFSRKEALELVKIHLTSASAAINRDMEVDDET